ASGVSSCSWWELSPSPPTPLQARQRGDGPFPAGVRNWKASTDGRYHGQRSTSRLLRPARPGTRFKKWSLATRFCRASIVALRPRLLGVMLVQQCTRGFEPLLRSLLDEVEDFLACDVLELLAAVFRYHSVIGEAHHDEFGEFAASHVKPLVYGFVEGVKSFQEGCLLTKIDFKRMLGHLECE